MTGDKTQVIVCAGHCASRSVAIKQVHHRGLPELCAEGHTAAEAASQLHNLLERARSSVGSGWRRAHVERAIEDVNAYLDDIARSEGATRHGVQMASPVGSAGSSA